MNEYTDIIRGFSGDAANAASAAVDDNADDAARAYTLGQATGVHPAVIHADLDAFEKQAKSIAASQIVSQNSHIQDYINSHPLAASISNDDLANLDEASEAMKKIQTAGVYGSVRDAMHGIRTWAQDHDPIQLAMKGSIERAVEGAKEGFGEGALGEDFYKQFPGAIGTYTQLFRIPEITAGFFRGMMALGYGAAAGGGQIINNVTGGTGAETELRQFVDYLFTRGDVALGGHAKAELPKGPTKITVRPQDAQISGALEQAGQVQDAMDIARPYLQSGKIPPYGLHPLIDQLHDFQLEEDLKAIDDAVAASAKTETRERSPELYNNFTRLGVQGDIGISFEAIRKLYGDKLPTADDGILGWVPNLEERLRAAGEIDGDVEVPLADYLARVDPEVNKALHDHLRIRGDGLTKAEVEEYKEHAKVMADVETPVSEAAPENDIAVQSIRKAAGLEPSADIGSEKKLKLQRVGDSSIKLVAANEKDSHLFAITDPSGKSVGQLQISMLKGGKQLYVDYVGSEGGARSFGMRQVRDLLAQLKAEFPQAESITGFRASGARWARDDVEGVPKEVFDPVIKLDQSVEDQMVQQLGGILNSGGEWMTVDKAHGLRANIKPTELYTQHEREIADKVMAIVSRLSANKAKTSVVHGLEMGGKTIQGAMYQYDRGLKSLILVSLDAKDEIGTARHEVIHYLYRNGFFTEGEWDTLRQAAVDEDWVGRYNVKERWPHLSEAEQLEEAIAEGFKKWDGRIDEGDPTHPIFQRLRELIDQIREMFKNVLGHEPTWQELFGQVEAGDIAKREEPFGPREAAAADQPEMFAPRPEWMTNVQYGRWRKAFEKRQAEDAERLQKKAESAARKRLTPQWKSDEASMRAKVEEEISKRPDFSADEVLSKGSLGGVKLGARVKLGGEFLTKEQKDALPEKYIAEKGVDPDDLAGTFGYQSGEQMIESLKRFNDAKGDMQPKKFFDTVVNAETQRRMERDYGDLEKNIMDEAEDHVLSESQMDMLHEQMMALGMKAGGQAPIEKGDVAKWVRGHIANLPMRDMNVEKLLHAAGNAGRALEMNLIKAKPDYEGAFQESQRQYIAVAMAKEAKKLQREMDKFEKLAKRFAKREGPSSVSAQHTNFIQDILMRTGNRVNRSVQDLEREIAASGHGSLKEFVAFRNSATDLFPAEENGPPAFIPLPLPDFVMDPNYRRPVKDMTVNEFRQVAGSVQALYKDGRADKAVEVAGEIKDREELIDQMTRQLDDVFGGKDKRPAAGEKSSGFRHIIRSGLAELMQLETVFNRVDRGDPNGLFNKLFIQAPEAANNKASMDKEFSKKFNDLGFYKVKMSKSVEQDLFRDPFTDELQPFTNKQKLAVLQNVGNQKQLDKLARGWNVDPGEIMSWLYRNTTKEDWDRAQKLGDLFEELFEQSETMYRNLTGMAPARIDIEPIETPFGTYRGWYHPLIYDPQRPGKSNKPFGGDVLDNGFFAGVAPSAGYTKARTGYAAPILLNFDAVPAKMLTMINDIAMRPAVMNLQKVFLDPKFKTSFAKNFGPEFADLLKPYLEDAAGQAQQREAAWSALDKFANAARQNIMATLIGLNIGTVLKHFPTALASSIKEVGPVAFAREAALLFAKNEDFGARNLAYALENSAELQRRSRNWEETLAGSFNAQFAKAGNPVGRIKAFRQFMIRLGSAPVAASDMVSAVPTWLAAYKDAIAAGETEGAAVAIGDRAVRRAHGSTAITSRSKFFRTSASQWIAPFSTFANDLLNRNYETAWKAKDMMGEFSEGNFAKGAAMIPDLAGRLLMYGIVPVLVEQAVEPFITDKDSKTSAGLKFGGRMFSWGIPGLRDVADFAIAPHRREPDIGLYSTLAKSATNEFSDLQKTLIGRNDPAKVAHHAFFALGALTGVTNEAEGRAAEFFWNLAKGKERAQNPTQIYEGLRHGTSRKHPQNFGEWMKAAAGAGR